MPDCCENCNHPEDAKGTDKCCCCKCLERLIPSNPPGMPGPAGPPPYRRSHEEDR